jgi:hypothetical protein
MGYLGYRRWRCRLTSGEQVDVPGTLNATTLLAADMFKGLPPGAEAKAMPVFELELEGRRLLRMEEDHRMFNGWNGVKKDAIPEAIAESVCDEALKAWARGVVPTPWTPLGAEFSPQAFMADVKPKLRCKRLRVELAARVAEHPSVEEPVQVFVNELQALGYVTHWHGCNFVDMRSSHAGATAELGWTYDVPCSGFDPRNFSCHFWFKFI